MTRFARKFTSRGTTLREPEAATPWSQMVATIQPRQDYGVEDEDEYMDVPEEAGDDEEEAPDHTNKEVKEEEDGNESEEEEDTEVRRVTEDGEDADQDSGEDYEARLEVKEEAKSLKRKVELVSSEEPKKKKRKKPAEKCKVCGSKEHRKMNCGMLDEERRKELQDLYKMKVGRAGQGTGRKKKKRKDKLPYEDIEPKQPADRSADQPATEGKKAKKKSKFKKSKEPQRDRSGAIVEKGEAIFHGFRVRKEDEKRLHDLYKELKSKGLTKTELDAAIKKERRNAEKNLARSKKLVCFKCRQPGHMLADCPLTADGDTRPSSGLCFKCGSMEHTSKDCKSKMKRESAYSFAVCFICKEAGHLAKACPDNPKGLYPKGGGCIFCGSVEHLKRDCLRKVEKDLKSGVRVGTIGDNLEDEPSYVRAPVRKWEKKDKVVKF